MDWTSRITILNKHFGSFGQIRIPREKSNIQIVINNEVNVESH